MDGKGILRPPALHIDAPLPDILEVIIGRLSSLERTKFENFSKLTEALSEFEFLELKRRIKCAFKLFSDGALGREFVGRVGKSLPSKEDLISRELRFVSDFLMLMQTAHYQLVSKELWEVALKEDFELTMPLKVDLKVMDSKMFGRFWKERPVHRQQLPDIADRILVFYRGLSVSSKTDFFINEKIDLLLQYLLIQPFSKLRNKGTSPETGQSEENVTPEEVNAEVVTRTTFVDLMPTTASVLRRLFSKVTISEPTFDSVVVMYRKAKATLLPSTPNTKTNFQQAKRNIVVKMFDSVPSADLELIFPAKVVSVRMISWIYIWITLIIAFFSAAMMIWQTDLEMAVIGSALMLFLGKAFQSYTAMQREKATMTTNISNMVYNKTRDSQDGALLTLLDDMADQHVKEVIVAYALLYTSPGMTSCKDELRVKCERFFEENFGRKVDFLLAEKLPYMINMGLAKMSPGDNNMIVAVDLDIAMDVFTEKWRGYYRKLGNLNADQSLFDNSVAKTLTPSKGILGGISKQVTNMGTSALRGGSSLRNIYGNIRRKVSGDVKMD